MRLWPECDARSADEVWLEIVVRSYRVIYGLDHGDCRVDVARFWHAARGTAESVTVAS